MALWLAVSFALAFAFTNGFHDASNAIATLVATRGARPGQAVVLSAIFNMLGALLVGTAVATTIAGIVTVSGADAVAVIGSGVLGAVLWNLLTWARGLPSSSAHALVGGLVGSALAAAGRGAVNWGGLEGWKPVGVLGVLIALALSPPIGFVSGALLIRLDRRLLRRATRRVGAPITAGEWAMTAALSFSHGANDAQKAMGAIAALLFASGREQTLTVPLWAKLGCGAALTVGTVLGGWRIVHTIGRGILRLGPLDAFASQTTATAVILPSSYAGAPVSTTHVVASSVVGIGAGRRRWRHVRWTVVRAMAFALGADPSGCRCAGSGYLPHLERTRMRRRQRWFLPETPDLLGMLGKQLAITVEGMQALVAWAGGDAAAVDRLRDCEHRADDSKRELRAALTTAFITPLEPEDLFELSRGLDRMLNNAKNAVREADVMQAAPDDAIAQMAAELADGVAHLSDAFVALGSGRDRGALATEAATRAAKSQSRLEHVYRHAMSDLVTVDDLREVAAKRELYRRFARTSEDLREVAERVWYSVLKQS